MWKKVCIMCGRGFKTTRGYREHLRKCTEHHDKELAAMACETAEDY